MGRAPCCDKMGMKKGPWTPEEDIALVTYIQEHGAGNWRAVPKNTGLPRCSKSCRLRWTNYLRPGIKRGSFTENEEKMIIHLQALLGNRWAAIASYLPQRTDNDIKNYWNTHLMKKLKKHPMGLDGHKSDDCWSSNQIMKGQWERRLQTDIHMARKALCDALSLDKSDHILGFQSSNGHCINTKPVQSSSSTYAWSTESVSRLLEGWMNNSPKSHQIYSESNTNSINYTFNADSSSSEGTPNKVLSQKSLESLLSFDSSTPETSQSGSFEETVNYGSGAAIFQADRKPDLETRVPLLMLEKWLLEESVAQGEDEIETMEMSLGDESDELF